MDTNEKADIREIKTIMSVIEKNVETLLKCGDLGDASGPISAHFLTLAYHVLRRKPMGHITIAASLYRLMARVIDAEWDRYINGEQTS